MLGPEHNNKAVYDERLFVRMNAFLQSYVCSYNSKKVKMQTCKPGSVIVAIYLDFLLPRRSSSLPAGSERTTHLLLDFAPDEVYRALTVTNQAVGSYPTVSPLPASRRSILCGTFCSKRSRELPGIMFYGARTFLWHGLPCQRPHCLQKIINYDQISKSLRSTRSAKEPSSVDSKSGIVSSTVNPSTSSK